MKKNPSANGRKHGLKSKPASPDRLTTTLTFEARAQVYHWFTDRGRSKPVLKH